MDGAAAFVAGYATLAELAALGINRVGVISARRQAGAVADGDTLPWPHVGSIALHRVVAAVAMTAAVLLALVMAVLHHSGADLAVLAVPVLVGLIALGRSATHVRAALRGAS